MTSRIATRLAAPGVIISKTTTAWTSLAPEALLEQRHTRGELPQEAEGLLIFGDPTGVSELAAFSAGTRSNDVFTFDASVFTSGHPDQAAADARVAALFDAFEAGITGPGGLGLPGLFHTFDRVDGPFRDATTGTLMAWVDFTIRLTYAVTRT